ncbi:MAG: hypothetical protein P4L91_14690 [Burkholderiaceae bacterium]|nr:hypothetical protein [Burkholderiaceae bacterium]
MRRSQVPDSAAPAAQTNGESKLQLNDPAALVRAYSYEASKSDLQKAIELHGGTVALRCIG